MVRKAKLEKSDSGKTPTSDGWFILHASEAQWYKSDRFGDVCDFEGDTQFPQIGVNIHVIQPNQPNCLYHKENAQENFFVLSGECVVLIEEREYKLKAGHFVHCPPETTHVFVGAGDKPCSILMIGYRPQEKGLLYPVSKLAKKYAASAEVETTNPREAYGKSPVFTKNSEPIWPL